MTVRRAMILVAASALLFGACGSSAKATSSSPTTVAPKARPHVTIEAVDYHFTVPPVVPAGWVDVTVHNRGKELHQMAFVKLGSVSFESFKAAVNATNVKAFADTASFVGGPNNVDPRTSVTTTVHFEPGEYGFACFITDAKGRPHSSLGMVGHFTVASTPDSPEVAHVVSGGTIDVSEFTFTVKPGFTGKGTVAFTNVGAQVHEAILVKEKPGKTLADVKNFFIQSATGASPPGGPPFTDAGGMTGLGRGQTDYEQMALTPGKYALLCFFPDPTKNNLPHALEGMIKEFTVS
jgi:uncharacterized cupredoxin-like copper-binding protein